MSVFANPPTPSAEELLVEGRLVGFAIRHPARLAELDLHHILFADLAYAAVLAAVQRRVEAGQPVTAEALKADLVDTPALAECGVGLVDVVVDDAAEAADAPGLAEMLVDRWQRRLLGQAADVLHTAAEEAGTNARGLTSRASGKAQVIRFAETIAGVFAILRPAMPPIPPQMLTCGGPYELLPVPLLPLELGALAAMHEQAASLVPAHADGHRARAEGLRSMLPGRRA